MILSSLSNCFVYVDKIVEAASLTLIDGESLFLDRYQVVMHNLGSHEKKIYFYSLIRILSKRHLSPSQTDDADWKESKRGALNGVIALIVAFLKGNPQLQDNSIEWLASTSSDSIGQSHDTHRVVIAALPGDQKKKVLRKVLELFGDKLYIKHTPILHQEGMILCSKPNVHLLSISLMIDSQYPNSTYGCWLCTSYRCLILVRSR